MRRIIIILIGLSCIASGCIRGRKSEGPETAVKIFYEAVVSGNWTEAETICDGEEMEAYIDEYRKTWEDLQKGDGNALDIASSILLGMEIKTHRTENTKDGRLVYYTLETGQFSKERRAYVVKEEGEWRLREIIDIP